MGVYVALSVAFCWPLLAQPYANGTGDWDQHSFYYASVLRSVASGQWPFWNPWYCGGNVLWQNPQVSLISPVYLLAWVMPLALAMKLNVVGHYIVGCLGMHLLLRRLIGVRSPFVVVYLVSLCVFSGGMALHLAAGHSNFLSVFWLPALAYCFVRAATGHTRHLLAGGAIIGVAILNGGPHVVPLAAVLLGSLGLGALLVGRTLRPLVVAVVIVVAGCAYAAPKLVPAAMFTASADFQDRRPVKRPDAMSLEMVRHALWDEFQTTALKLSPGVQRYGWHEYGNYLGWFGASLMLVAAAWVLVFGRRREAWLEASAAISLAVVLLVTAGEFSSYAPAGLMRNLPFFSNFRIPSRFILLVPLAGSACLAFLARRREDRPGSPGPRAFVEIACVVAVCQLGLVNRQHFRDVFILPPTDVEARRLDRSPPTVAEHEPPSAAWTGLGENSNLVRSMAAGVSPLNCYEPLLVKRIAAPGPAIIRADGPITFSATDYAPNRVAASVAVGGEPVRVVLNQNFSDGWSSSVGPIERDPASGLPSAVLPAGYAGTIAFTFRPRGLWIGWIVWIVAIGLSIAAWIRAAPSLRAARSSDRPASPVAPEETSR